MAITTDTVLADTVPTVLESARFTSEFVAEMSKLVWNIRKELHDGKNINLPLWGTVTARALAEGIDNTVSETMSDTLVTITPGEVGCKIILTDKLVRDNNEDVKAAAGRLLGNAMEVKRDQDLLLQFQSGGTTLGAGSTATLGQFAAARAILKGVPVTSGGPAPGTLVIVHHPYVTLDIVDELTPLIPSVSSTVAGAIGLADEVIRNYGVGKLFGMPYIEDGNIDTVTVANSARGGVFAPGEGGAIILATASEWGVEPERDASLRATELNIVGEYGVGIYEADWIVDMAHDATLPA
mgnify:CR=1 FL=1